MFLNKDSTFFSTLQLPFLPLRSFRLRSPFLVTFCGYLSWSPFVVTFPGHLLWSPFLVTFPGHSLVPVTNHRRVSQSVEEWMGLWRSCDRLWCRRHRKQLNLNLMRYVLFFFLRCQQWSDTCFGACFGTCFDTLIHWTDPQDHQLFAINPPSGHECRCRGSSQSGRGDIPEEQHKPGLGGDRGSERGSERVQYSRGGQGVDSESDCRCSGPCSCQSSFSSSWVCECDCEA